MSNTTKSLFSSNSKTVHLIGIGGVSMSALAEVLEHRGFTVRGSDMQEGVNTARLARLGIKCVFGHRGENIDGADMVIRTSAVHDDNPEVMRARQLGIPVIERAQAWGALMTEYRDAVCISGTHGKTTTTSMTTHIALEARLDPQVMVGANLPIIGGNVRVARGNLFIAEACEYCDSFLNFNPTIAVISNIEEDHLDYFKDIDHIISSFRSFAARVPENGCVVVNFDDECAMRAVEGLERRTVTFGLGEGADLRAVNIAAHDTKSEFTLVRGGEELARISVPVPGRHNIYNALAAAAAALELGVSPKCVAAGLSKYAGVGRRFEKKGEVKGAMVYDDYAHHPGEVRATLSTVRDLSFERVICVFQSHTYTRTAALKDEFIHALSLADKVLVAPIYAAREKNIIGISGSHLAEGIDGAEYIESFEGLRDRLLELAQPGDLIITMGAGDIYLVGEMLVDSEKQPLPC